MYVKINFLKKKIAQSLILLCFQYVMRRISSFFFIQASRLPTLFPLLKSSPSHSRISRLVFQSLSSCVCGRWTLLHVSHDFHSNGCLLSWFYDRSVFMAAAILWRTIDATTPPPSHDIKSGSTLSYPSMIVSRVAKHKVV